MKDMKPAAKRKAARRAPTKRAKTTSRASTRRAPTKSAKRASRAPSKTAKKAAAPVKRTPSTTALSKLPKPAAVAAGLALRAGNAVRGAIKGRADTAVTEISRFDESHDRLWTTMSAEVPCAVRRDASYLNWKYVDQPGQDFLRLEVSAPGGEWGVVILMFREPDSAYQYGRAFIVDLVAPLHDDDAEHAHERDADRHHDREQDQTADDRDHQPPARSGFDGRIAGMPGLLSAASSGRMTLPSLRRIVRCVRAATSGSCVTTSIVMPVRWISDIRSMICWLVSLSRAPVGSSARMRRGLPISARAIATRCF